MTIGLLAGLPALVAVLLAVTGVGPRPGAVQAVFIVVFLGAAWANFATKDIKS